MAAGRVAEMQPLELAIACIAAGIVGYALGLVIHGFWTGQVRIVFAEPEPVQVDDDAPAERHAPETVAAAVKAEVLTVAEWASWNGWYHADPVLALEAQHLHMALRRDKPEQPLEDNLAEVTAEMRRRHPTIMTVN